MISSKPVAENPINTLAATYRHLQRIQQEIKPNTEKPIRSTRLTLLRIQVTLLKIELNLLKNKSQSLTTQQIIRKSRIMAKQLYQELLFRQTMPNENDIQNDNSPLE